MGKSATKPAKGPASPISKSARRDGMGDFIFMNAPNVPARNSGGAGIKKGSVALTHNSDRQDNDPFSWAVSIVSRAVEKAKPDLRRLGLAIAIESSAVTMRR